MIKAVLLKVLDNGPLLYFELSGLRIIWELLIVTLTTETFVSGRYFALLAVYTVYIDHTRLFVVITVKRQPISRSVKVGPNHTILILTPTSVHRYHSFEFMIDAINALPITNKTERGFYITLWSLTFLPFNWHHSREFVIRAIL